MHLDSDGILYDRLCDRFNASMVKAFIVKALELRFINASMVKAFNNNASIVKAFKINASIVKAFNFASIASIV